jgi:aminopeptidase-like protein/aminoglycoside N3'-acetyltransferase
VTARLELRRPVPPVEGRPAGTWHAGELTDALRRLGAREGDVMMLHVHAEALGRLTPGDGMDGHATLLAAARAAVGDTGTILCPTYTFSFCRQELFDRDETPTAGGPWSPSAGFLEYFRKRPDAVRSRDPIHSIAGQGPRAVELLSDAAATCFGVGSVFDRLVQADALVCLIGLPLEEATIRHHAEETAGVPFRFRKLFTGQVREGGVVRKQGWVYHVRIMAENAMQDGRRLEAEAIRRDVARRVTVGAGDVIGSRARSLHDLTLELLESDPWATARGPAGDPAELERARVGGRRFDVALPPNASMPAMIDALWALPRDIVSDGYDAALAALATQFPMTIHEYPTGMECWSWLVPEKWTCHEAWLETLDGRRIFSYADHPLHVVSYSLPFEGVVTRDELRSHLFVHPCLPDAVPFVFKYYERTWGLCCSATLRDSLQDEHYRVVIRTTFSHGTLKVGEVIVPGRTDDTFVLCAHLCHPAMTNDDLTGVVVGLDVMRTLRAGPPPRCTVRFLIVPETIGSIAYLSRHAELIPRLRGGLFLEMLGRNAPHGLQLSFDGSTRADRCGVHALQERDPAGWTTPFRSLAGNDERQFNAPGVRVPMLSLTRQLPPAHPDFPYREYHSSADTPDLVPPGSLEASRDLVLRMLEIFDADVTPTPRYAGEICCSRYGIHVDAATDPAGNRALFDVLFLIDGTRSVVQIADQCGVPFASVAGIVAQLRAHGLVMEQPCAS